MGAQPVKGGQAVWRGEDEVAFAIQEVGEGLANAVVVDDEHRGGWRGG